MPRCTSTTRAGAGCAGCACVASRVCERRVMECELMGLCKGAVGCGVVVVSCFALVRIREALQLVLERLERPFVFLFLLARALDAYPQRGVVSNHPGAVRPVVRAAFAQALAQPARPLRLVASQARQDVAVFCPRPSRWRVLEELEAHEKELLRQCELRNLLASLAHVDVVIVHSVPQLQTLESV